MPQKSVLILINNGLLIDNFKINNKLHFPVDSHVQTKDNHENVFVLSQGRIRQRSTRIPRGHCLRHRRFGYCRPETQMLSVFHVKGDA